MNKIELESVNCNLCGSNDTNLLYKKPDTRFWVSPIEFNLVQCKDCGLAFVNPRPTQKSMNYFYPSNFYLNRDIAHEKIRFLKEIQLIEKYKESGRILDIGCGGGGLTKMLKEKGWEVYGMDLYEKSGNNYNINIKYGDLKELKYPSNFFDVITAWAVFEHLYDPMSYFLEIRRMLKQNSIFICLVNNINSIWSRYAYGEDMPRHLYVFSEKTLKKYGEKAGLMLEGVDYSNEIFKAWSRDVFSVRFLKSRDFNWREIYKGDCLPTRYKYTAYFLHALGRIFIPIQLESQLKIPGIIIGVFKKL